MQVPSKAVLTLAALAALGMAADKPATAQSAHLTLQSQPGDDIGQGKNYDITYTPANVGNGGGVSAAVFGLTTGGLPDYIFFNFQKVDPAFNVFDFGSLLFSTQKLNTPLAPGTYTSAERAPFESAGHPGLDFNFNSRGSNTLTGSFTISNLILSRDASSFNGFRVDAFDGTFEQHSEGAVPALFGQFSYRAAGAPVPEASTTVSLGLLLALGVGGLVIATKRKRSSASR